MIHIIFLEPQNSGNVGAIARAMANFNLNSLIIINPKCNPKDEESYKRAKHANKILDNAKIEKDLELKYIDYYVGTTSAIGNDYNIPRSPITAENLAEKLKEINAKNSKINIGIIIGREGDGLTNHELLLCDFVVTIPTFPDYPSMNASHAASIIFYELFKHSEFEKNNDLIEFATETDKKILMKELEKVLKNLEFATEEKRDTQRIVWKKMIGKSFLTKREVMALIGFLKKL